MQTRPEPRPVLQAVTRTGTERHGGQVRDAQHNEEPGERGNYRPVVPLGHRPARGGGDDDLAQLCCRTGPAISHAVQGCTQCKPEEVYKVVWSATRRHLSSRGRVAPRKARTPRSRWTAAPQPVREPSGRAHGRDPSPMGLPSDTGPLYGEGGGVQAVQVQRSPLLLPVCASMDPRVSSDK
jgi:hypothetical protein